MDGWLSEFATTTTGALGFRIVGLTYLHGKERRYPSRLTSDFVEGRRG
jgi:hypothetical protein